MSLSLVCTHHELFKSALQAWKMAHGPQKEQ